MIYFAKRNYVKILSFLVIFALILPGNVLTQGVSSPGPTVDEVTPQTSTFMDADAISIPPHLGEIKFTYKPDVATDKIVVHIQDAHCNIYAQKKIYQIIDYLNTEYGIDLINLEGGSGVYDLGTFTQIAEKDLRREVAGYFLKNGQINGAEFYGIINPDAMELWGIEDKDLYLKNLKVYRDSLIYKDEVEEHLKDLTYIFNNLKRHMFTPGLLEIDVNYASYKAGNKEFKDYVEFLIRKAGQQGIELDKFKNLSLMVMTMETESKVDFKKADSDQYGLVETLKERLSRNQLKELTVKTLEFRQKKITRKKFYGYLLKKGKELRLEINKYKELKKYIEYVSIYESIDFSLLMEEIGSLEAEIKDKFIREDKVRRLDVLSKNLVLLKNIFSIKLTRTDYQYFISNRDSFDISGFVDFIEKYAPECGIKARTSENIKSMDGYLHKISEFFKFSFERDDAFIENMRYCDMFDGKKAALIMTGGFHTDNLTALFRDNNISFISILPKFTSKAGYESPYFKLLSGEIINMNSVLGKMMAGASLIAVASYLSENIPEEVYGEDGLNEFKASVRIVEEMSRIKEDSGGASKVVLLANGEEITSIGEGNRIEIKLRDVMLSLGIISAGSGGINYMPGGKISKGFSDKEVGGFLERSKLRPVQVNPEIKDNMHLRFKDLYGRVNELSGSLEGLLGGREMAVLKKILREINESEDPNVIHKYFDFFRAKVDGKGKYILGERRAFAIDVVKHLLAQRDRTLLDEYILHELLEQTSLDHEQIIGITSRFFNRNMPEGFRPKDTPLGKALREFIDRKARERLWDKVGLDEGAELEASMQVFEHPFRENQFTRMVTCKGGKGTVNLVHGLMIDSILEELVDFMGRPNGLKMEHDMSYNPFKKTVGVDEYPLVFPHEIGHVIFMEWLLVDTPEDDLDFRKGVKWADGEARKTKFWKAHHGIPEGRLTEADVPNTIKRFQQLVGAKNDYQRLTDAPIGWGNSLNELFAHNIERLTYGAPFLVVEGSMTTTEEMLEYYKQTGIITAAEADNYLRLSSKINDGKPVQPIETREGYHISPEFGKEALLQKKKMTEEDKLGRDLTVVEEAALRAEGKIDTETVAEVEGWLKGDHPEDIFELFMDGGFYFNKLSTAAQTKFKDRLIEYIADGRAMGVPAGMVRYLADRDQNEKAEYDSSVYSDRHIEAEDISQDLGDMSESIAGISIKDVRPRFEMDVLVDMAREFGVLNPENMRIELLRIKLAEAQLKWAVKHNLISYSGLEILFNEYYEKHEQMVEGISDKEAIETRKAITSYLPVYNDIDVPDARHVIVGNVLRDMKGQREIFDRVGSRGDVPNGVRRREIIPGKPEWIGKKYGRSIFSAHINSGEWFELDIAPGQNQNVVKVTNTVDGEAVLWIGNRFFPIDLENSTKMTFGRDPRINMYTLDQYGQISREHFTINVMRAPSGGFIIVVEDRGSKNGTKITFSTQKEYLERKEKEYGAGWQDKMDPSKEMSAYDASQIEQIRMGSDSEEMPAFMRSDQLNVEPDEWINCYEGDRLLNPSWLKLGNYDGAPTINIQREDNNAIINIAGESLDGMRESLIEITPEVNEDNKLILGRGMDKNLPGATIFRAHEYVSREHLAIWIDDVGNVIVEVLGMNGAGVDKKISLRLKPMPVEWSRSANTMINPEFIGLPATGGGKTVLEVLEVTKSNGVTKAVYRERGELGLKVAYSKKDQDIIIGRNPERSDLVIDKRSENVSRAHAKIRYIEDGKWAAEDLASMNGTYYPLVEIRNADDNGLIGKVIDKEGNVKTEGFDIERKGSTLRIGSTSDDMESEVILETGEEMEAKYFLDKISGLLSGGGRSTLVEADRMRLQKLFSNFSELNKVVVIKDAGLPGELNENADIRGIFDKEEGVLYLNGSLLEDPLALIHEFGEGYVEVPKEFPEMTKHTFMRGAGKDVRAAFDALLGELGEDEVNSMDIDGLINALNQKMSGEGFPISDIRRKRISDGMSPITESEVALMEYNAQNEHKLDDSIGIRRLLFGLQDHIDPDRNMALTSRIHDIRGDMLGGVVNIHLIRNSNMETFTKQENVARKFSRTTKKNEKVDISVRHFQDRDGLKYQLKEAVKQARGAFAEDERTRPKITVDCLVEDDLEAVGEAIREIAESEADGSPEAEKDIIAGLQGMIIKINDPVSGVSLDDFKPNEAKIVAVADILCNDNRLIDNINKGRSEDEGYDASGEFITLKKHALFLQSCGVFGLELTEEIGQLEKFDIDKMLSFMQRLMDGDIRLKITQVDWEEISDWNEAQKEVLSSL